MSILKFFMTMFRYQKKHPVLLTFLFLSVVLVVIFQCVQPLIFEWLLNKVLISKDGHLLVLALSILLANYLMFVFAFLMRMKILSRMGAEIIAHIRYRLFVTIQNLNLDNHYQKKSPPLVSYFSEHISLIESITLFETWSVTGDFFICIVGGALLFYFNWIISLVILPVLVLILVLPRYFAQKTGRALEVKQAVDGNVLDDVQESIAMHDVIRLGLLKTFKKNQFKDVIDKSIHANYEYNINLGFTSISLTMGINFAMLVISCLGSILVFSGLLSIGSFIAFILLFRSFLTAINGMSNSLPILMRCASSLDLIEKLLATYPGKSPKQPLLPKLENQLNFNEVSFSYGERMALRQVNVTIKPGQFIGVVGLSGSGKSTFLKLVLKELKPTAGEIKFDQKNYADFSEQALLPQISVVMQEPKLFENSILENIRMGRLEATDEDIFAAARKAGVHEEILQFPQQYNTVVGQKKAGLSGGQCQRICIARALVADPAILCLDEASSALDPFAASLIEKTIEEMIGMHTIISITHRLSSVVHANLIVVMNHGEVIETGTHDALVRQKGFYSELWSKQQGFTFKPEQGFVSVDPAWLKKIPLFANFDEAMMQELAESMVTERLDMNELVFKQGDRGDKFYIIAIGKVDIISTNVTGVATRTATLSDGDFFGEVALLYDCERNATVKTRSNCLFLTLGADVFYKIIQTLPEKQQRYLLDKANERLTEEQKKRHYASRLNPGEQR